MKGPRSCVVVLAAGTGSRAGGDKQFRRAGGRSLLQHCLEAFAGCREIGAIVVVVPPSRVERTRAELEGIGLGRLHQVVAGGATRHDSSRAGLAAVPASCELVLIHDAARPFVSPALVRRVLRAAWARGAAIPAIPVHDSVVELDAESTVGRYLPRAELRAVQTPQGFRRVLLEEAFRKGRGPYTDDAGAVHRLGHPVAVVPGELQNAKITTAEELQAALLRLRAGGGS